MAQLATLARFEQGGWYSDYTASGPALAASRIGWVLAQAPPAPAKIAVAGSGWGYLIKELRDAGRDAGGFDASSYASLKYVGIEPGQGGRNVVANVLTAVQMTNFRRNTMGLSGSTKIPLMVSEDLLPCLTDAEVTTALTQMRANATKVVHIITCAAASDLAGRSGDLNWKTQAGWKSLVGSDLVYDTETKAVI